MAEQAEVDALTEESDFREALPSIDSLDHVEFIMTIEEHYQIEITDDEVYEAKTIGQLIDLICLRTC